MDTVGKVGYSLTSDNRWCEGSEVRGPGPGMRDAPPPGVEAHQIDGDRCDNVLESRFGEPAVPRLAQFEGTDSLGQGAFDPSPSAVALLPLLRLLVLAEVLQGLVVSVWPERQVPWSAGSCPCAEGRCWSAPRGR